MTHSIRDERTPKDICGEATLGWDTYDLASLDPVIQDGPLEWYPNTVALALRERPPIGHPLLSGHFQKIISFNFFETDLCKAVTSITCCSDHFRGPNEFPTRRQNNQLPFVLSSPRVCSDRWNQVE